MLESWFLIGEGILYQVISRQSYRNLINEGYVHKIITLQTNIEKVHFSSIFFVSKLLKKKKKERKKAIINFLFYHEG